MNGIGAMGPEQALARIANRREDARPIEPWEFAARQAHAQELMHAANLDAVVLPAGPSLRYFTGAAWGMYERFTGAVIPCRGETVFVVPAFEQPRLGRTLDPGARLLTWEEDASPYAACGAALRDLGLATCRIGIDESAPYFVATGIADAVPQVSVESAAGVVGSCRCLKSAAEIALIRHAMQTTLEVHRLAAATLREGVSNEEVIALLNAAHLAAGSDSGSTFAIVAFGPSTAYPHGPERREELAEGDLVLVDTGCTFHGYHADLTRTYVFGDPSPRHREIWEIEQEAQQAAFAAVEVGAACATPDDAARRVLESYGFGPDYQTPGLPHRTGHGIGLEIHERPYLVRGNSTPFEVGMCASIEPMLCLYGEMGVRLEDHFYVAEQGPVWFTEPSPSVDEPFGTRLPDNSG